MIHLSHKIIKRIKIIFNTVFISIIVFNLIKRTFTSFQDNRLFFFTSDAIENFIFALIAYISYFFVLKLNSTWKKTSFLSLFLIILLSLALLKDYRRYNAITFEMTFEYFTSFLGQIILFYSLVYFVNRLEFFSHYKKLENELNQTKAQLLQNQLHPHFLFNAFNSLYSLSLKNHPNTSDYILKISNMMRYLTDETSANRVPLIKELDFIKQYISIEKIRFGNEAPIQLKISKKISSEKLIAPLLLITLVENAFKHGFYTNSKNAYVNMQLNLKNNDLIFSVENSILKKQHFQEGNRTGKGIQNLKQRLSLLYPKKSSLKIKTTKNSYSTKLKITLD